ncbi:MAG: hypothetical protein K1X74_07790 [Pirellulales bacterium]|nr:hypothetical protein [Pirellulales bacterium]
MGLKIHSLEELPSAPARGYYVYLLDYGWDEPLGRALHDNFDEMANAASRNNAAVILGVGNEFNDEVLSWHGVNGRNADDLLPAILITNKPPREFREQHGSWRREHDHLVIIPLRDQCKTATDVVRVIASVFADIKANRPLANFEVAREDRAGLKGAILDAIVLRPTFGGIGVDLKALLNKLVMRRQDRA